VETINSGPLLSGQAGWSALMKRSPFQGGRNGSEMPQKGGFLSSVGNLYAERTQNVRMTA
jgi:hypothetical protein